MMFNKNLKNFLLVIFATLILSACSTGKRSGNIDGDVYTGKETVKYLASGVPDRVFFATNKSSLTTAARDYLMTYGISGKRLSVISYGKEKPVNPASTPLAWSQNRRSVTVKVN